MALGVWYVLGWNMVPVRDTRDVVLDTCVDDGRNYGLTNDSAQVVVGDFLCAKWAKFLVVVVAVLYCVFVTLCRVRTGVCVCGVCWELYY